MNEPNLNCNNSMPLSRNINFGHFPAGNESSTGIVIIIILKTYSYSCNKNIVYILLILLTSVYYYHIYN